MILDEQAMERAITRISFEIIERNKGVQDLCIIGIMSRGDELAKLIAQKIENVEKTKIPVGFLDITAFRDDINEDTKKNISYSRSQKTQIDFSIEGKKVILVDDVIYTGRSVRSAIDAIMDKGRAKLIQLAVLVDRGHRELPIRADFIGKNLPTANNEIVDVLVKNRDGINQVTLTQKPET